MLVINHFEAISEVDGKRVDKDAVLADCMDFKLEPNTHSPVILGPGDTADYIETPRPEFLSGKFLELPMFCVGAMKWSSMKEPVTLELAVW